MRKLSVGVWVMGVLWAGVAYADGTAVREQPIVDGAPASLDELNATVSILLFDEDDFVSPHCTGTLIGPRVVLTASHCIRLANDDTNEIERTLTIDDIIVAVGALDAVNSTDEQTYYADNIAYHDDFPSDAFSADPDGLGQDFDIALLVLDRDVVGVTPVPILPMERFDDVLQQGTEVIISGYGNQGPSENADAGVLYIARTPYQRRSDFEFIVGQAGSPDTCPGDSGGPVYVDDGSTRYVIGASARGIESTAVTCGEGGIYTLVPAYMDWINARVGDSIVDNGGGNSGGGDNGGGGNVGGDNGGGGDVTGDGGGDAAPDALVGGDDGGGCQTAPGAPAPGVLLLLMAVGWLWRRSSIWRDAV